MLDVRSFGKASSFVPADDNADQSRHPKLRMISSTLRTNMSSLEASGGLGRIYFSHLNCLIADSPSEMLQRPLDSFNALSKHMTKASRIGLGVSISPTTSTFL